MRKNAYSSTGLLVFVLLLQSQFNITFANEEASSTNSVSYPLKPDANITPGSLCGTPNQYRYPEKIPYCNRNVSSDLKMKVITVYVTQFGYNITRTNRSSFKIDHYIPLCMGGSNNQDNLWPQHQDVYTITDQIENLSCIKMSAGKLKQADGVQLIKRVKNKLSEAPAVIQFLESL